MRQHEQTANRESILTLPTSRPVIDPAPGRSGLWLAYGHSHSGLTLGPVTGRLLADMMTGATPFCDPTHYRAERFGA
jgi:D-amino-acid dehydrogenase